MKKEIAMKKQTGYWKGFTSALVLVALVMSLGITATAASTRTIEVEDGVKIEINDAKFTPKDVNGKTVPVFIYNGTTYAPIRAVCEAAGMDVEFDSKTRTVSLTTPDWALAQDPDADSYISADRAKEIALADAGVKKADAVFLKVKLEWSDGVAVYDVEFYSKGTEYDYEINARTGKILESERELDNFEAPSYDEFISADEAKRIALKDAGLKASQVSIRKVKLDWDDGQGQYEVKFTTEDYEYEYEIDAVSGRILSVDKDPQTTVSNTGKLISAEKAQSIALKKAGSGAVVEKCELDEDDGRMIYELELRNGKVEYECEIDAETGTILKWEIDD